VTPWTALRIGGSGEYIASTFETRVLDLASDGVSLVGPVLATPGDLTGTLTAFDDESASAESMGEALEQAAGRLLDGAAPSVRACRDSRAALRPELSGALDVAFTIDGDGLPHDVVVKGASRSAEDEALNRCVKLVIEGLRFPRGATGRVKVERLVQLPPPPASLGARKCSDVSRLPMPLRRGAWWTRLTQNEPPSVYVQAKRQCELATWTDRRALLELMLVHQADGVARVDLANRLALLGEPDAAALLRREAVRRVKSPEELANVRRALLGSERYPGSLFEERYKAAPNDQERLEVVRRFLELAPHDSRLRRQLLALLEALNRPAEVVPRKWSSCRDSCATIRSPTRCCWQTRPRLYTESVPIQRRTARLASCRSARPKIRGCEAFWVTGYAPKVGSMRRARRTPRSKSWCPMTRGPRCAPLSPTLAPVASTLPSAC
jgi:hypothetical protein